MFSLQDYQRYGRQMILDGFGLPGQVKLKQASVVVVGAGGLGCPALQYLGAAGIGRIGIIDHDHVELSNLHRQILHSEDTIGLSKAESAARALKRSNSHLTVDALDVLLTPENALSLLHSYDVILDCTDNVPTRYLLSDAAVILQKPLVSGAAQKFEGQLCVYNLGLGGPCYRCLYPSPPPPNMVSSCDELGILGVVTGVIGNMQALETIKIILGHRDQAPSMLLFSALNSPPFRSVRLRNRSSTCISCRNPNPNDNSLTSTDYIQFCGGGVPNRVEEGLVEGNVEHRIRAKDLHELMSSVKCLDIIDVRPPTEFGICQLPGSRNVPLQHLLNQPEIYISSDESETFVICRLGNDSQIASEALRRVSSDKKVKDVIGGLRAWSNQVDTQFPLY